MDDPNPFSAKLAEVRTAMEREEWARAIKTMENIGPIPEKFQTVASNILFFLYISRNEFAKLARISGQFKPQRSKDAVSALLLLRDKALEYPVQLPANWSVDAWEKAVGAHARAGALEAKEVRLCLFFLALLNRPALLEMLHFMGLAAGDDLEDEVVAIIVRCFIRHGKFAEARRFLWTNNSRNISFTRFSFLVDRAEKGETAVPESDDKFLRFLRHRFGANVPAQIPLTRIPMNPHPDQWYGCRTYSQHGEDLVFLNIFRLIGVKNITWLDIGAHHPFNISNTALLYELGHRGINVEANPNLIPAFTEHRPGDTTLPVGVSTESGEMNFYLIDQYSGRNSFDKRAAVEFCRAYPEFKITEIIKVPVLTVREVLQKCGRETFPDLLSLDVEGLDEKILLSLDLKADGPKIICVEDNDRPDNTASPLRDQLAAQGYFPYYRAGVNILFVRNEYRPLLT